jgi:transcriptional regulator with XRE-family HTH domain
MPARPLTEEQRADAARLKDAMARAKRDFGLTQSDLATLCGWDSQSTVSQYANGRIPLNTDSLGIMCIHLRIPMHEISPTLARRLALLAQTLPRDTRTRAAGAWPFQSVTRAQLDGLSAEDRTCIERHMRWVIEQARNPASE